MAMEGLRVCGLLLVLPALVPALEPITVTTGALLGVLGGVLVTKFRCRFMECCTEHQPLSLAGLQLDLSLDVYGQPLATALILEALKKHIATKHPSKPLVLSFHGWTGTGKTFVSTIIAKNLYEKGEGSKFVHIFDATLHFPHNQHVNLYKRQLQKWLQGNLSSCPQSLFVFAEMDEMPHGLIDVVSPFLYHRQEKSFGQAIFIFLNNVGGKNIYQVALDFWRRGKRREDMQLKDLEPVLAVEVFKNTQSGFWNSKLIKNNLIDFFVPFLPLEHAHVEKCVKAELQSRGFIQNPKVIQEILLDLVDFPKPEKIYASRGCKTISSRVDLYT